MQSRIPALEKQIGIDLVHSRIMKIVFCTKDSRLRASPRHGREGVFFDSHRSAAGASRQGWRHSLYLMESGVTILT